MNIQRENPFALFYTGDFNGHSRFWWPDGDTNAEGKEIEEMLTSLNLSHLMSEPTNFTPGKKPTCIDLIITDQPNLVLDSGTRPALDPKCHHHIIYSKIHFEVPPPPPIKRKIWHYDKAKVEAIRRSLVNFPWSEQLSLNDDPNWQINLFNETFLNVMLNFIPNEIKNCVPRDPPWINNSLKTLLKKKNRLYAHYKKHGYKEDDRLRLESFRSECQEAVMSAKRTYLTNLGIKLKIIG